MKNKLAIIILILAVSLALFPAYEFMPGNVKVKTMTFNTTALILGIDNVIVNPASITGTDVAAVNASYENLLYLINTFAVAGAYKTSYGTIGAKYSELFVLGDYANTDSIISTGTRLYTERAGTVTYGIPLAEVLSFGTNVNILYLDQKDYGSNIYYTVDLGFIGTIYERWNIGIAVSNLTSTYIESSIDEHRYYFDRKVSAGISFLPYKNLITSFDVSKAAGWPTSFGGAIQYELFEDLFTIRAGVKSFPIQYGAGFEVQVRNFSIDYGYTADQFENAVHHIQLNYTF